MACPIEVWHRIFPDRAWPGIGPAFEHFSIEIEALRMVMSEAVGQSLDYEDQMREPDEVQRAHDIVGQYAVERQDPVIFEHVSALCWVLRHDHNTAFPQILEAIEEDLRRRGIKIVRLPEVVDPAKERT